MDWQPIETAPKDRTILVYGQPTDIPELQFTGPGTFTAYWDEIDSAFCLTGGTWRGPFIKPTHWMPLPPLPSPTMSEIEKLIAKLEAASDGSKALDIAIWLTAVSPTISPEVETGWEKLPAYTTSLDAALTLVPDLGSSKFDWSLGFMNGSWGHAARVAGPAGEEGMCEYGHRPAALALCIAALKARSFVAGLAPATGHETQHKT